MTITYQQAKRIRKTGFLDLMADQLMYEKKVTTAIGKTISLKSRGTMMGIGQYFDPLNIARIMTFGSSIGPALLGHFTGRSAQDIQYFSKRYKPLHEKRKTGEKLTRLGGSGGFDVQSNQVLNKIYALMANSYEMEKTRKQLAKNREEEHELEDQKKHKELLQALQTRPTLVKMGDGQSEKSWTEKLLEFMKTVGTLFSGVRMLIQNALGKVVGWMLKRLGSVAKMIVSLMSKTGGFLFNMIRAMGAGVLSIFRSPVFLRLMGVAGVAAAIYEFHNSLMFKEGQMNRINSELIDEYRMLDYLKSKHGEDSNIVSKQEDNIAKLEIKKSDLQAEIHTIKKPENQDVGSLIGQFGAFFDSISNPFSDLSLDDSTLSKLEQVPDINVSEDLSSVDIGSGGNWDSAFKGIFNERLAGFDRTASDNAKIASGQGVVGELQRLPKEPVAAQNVTAPSRPATTVATPSIENSDTKLQNRMVTSVPKVQNNTTNIKQGSDGIPLKRKIPSVRNAEESYTSALFQNVRMPN